WLLEFDKAMVALAKAYKIHAKAPVSLYIDDEAQVLVYERGGLIFALNFSPNNSYDSYFVRTPNKAAYEPVLSTDEERFGGWNRIAMPMTYQAIQSSEKGYGFPIYLPARTGVCLVKVKRSYRKKQQ
ncbi:MAG: alpha amylase C-terminal domain-containing protein, partial [Lachnospiraceae bacterium]|nr:alpha amylase C-terminal domain-containing protein [Lachnospiraceae bacterium]